MPDTLSLRCCAGWSVSWRGSAQECWNCKTDPGLGADLDALPSRQRVAHLPQDGSHGVVEILGTERVLT
jgi:hypothetical protein